MSCNKEVVTDIEDIVTTRDDVRSSPNINQVLPRALRKHAPPPSAEGDSFIPGSQSVYVKTWGCSHNTSDGEYMAGLLAASGYAITGNKNSAHLIYIIHKYYNNRVTIGCSHLVTEQLYS